MNEVQLNLNLKRKILSYVKNLIEKLKSLLNAAMCLSTGYWLLIWIVLSCLFWWIYMGLFLFG